MFYLLVNLINIEWEVVDLWVQFFYLSILDKYSKENSPFHQLNSWIVEDCVKWKADLTNPQLLEEFLLTNYSDI